MITTIAVYVVTYVSAVIGLYRGLKGTTDAPPTQGWLQKSIFHVRNIDRLGGMLIVLATIALGAGVAKEIRDDERNRERDGQLAAKNAEIDERTRQIHEQTAGIQAQTKRLQDLTVNLKGAATHSEKLRVAANEVKKSLAEVEDKLRKTQFAGAILALNKAVTKSEDIVTASASTGHQITEALKEAEGPEHPPAKP